MSYLVFVAAALFLGIVLYVCEKRRVSKFDAKFPPIDDDEFVRRCRPGVNRDVALRVRRIISEQLGVEYERIYPDQKFVEDLNC